MDTGQILKLASSAPWTMKLFFAMGTDDFNCRTVTILQSLADKERYLKGEEVQGSYARITFELIEDMQYNALTISKIVASVEEALKDRDK